MDRRSPHVLTVAPMCFYPPVDGGSVRIARIAEAIAGHGITNTVAGMDHIMDSRGRVESLPHRRGLRPARHLTGLIALLRFGHYNEVKLCTASWKKRVLEKINPKNYEIIYLNYIFTYPFMSDIIRDQRLVIDTGNSEWQWFDRFAENTTNPLVRLLCYSSKRRADRIMKDLPAGTVMVHCSPSDLADYRARRPDLDHRLVPSGCRASFRGRSPDYTDKVKKLLFFGNLSGKMNYDALCYFRDLFWPSLCDLAAVTVAGSNPSRQVRHLCRQHRWLLRPDVPGDRVGSLFEEAHFAILPFRYGVGAKLKLLDACSRGIPTITTSAGACGQAGLPPTLIVADSPSEWRAAIARTDHADKSSHRHIADFYSQYEWSNVVVPLVDVMRGARGREIAN